MYVSVLLLWHHQIMKIACRFKNWLFEGELLALVERFAHSYSTDLFLSKGLITYLY